MSDVWDDFDPSVVTRSVLHWAQSHGATTLGEAFDLLPLLEAGNDVPEVLGETGTVEEVRDEIDEGIQIIGPDADLADLL